MPDTKKRGVAGWRSSLAVYGDRRVLLILLLGFSSGLPLLLTFTTLSAWLATAGVKRAAIGAFALVGTPYAFKFVWSPLIDRLPPPLPLGRRRGWGVTIQIALIVAILGLGLCDPKHHLALMGALALLVAFLSASQDIVIDAWRVEILTLELQGAGAGMIQTGYRIGMLVAGAGALVIAARAGWFAAYASMAALVAVGMLVFLFGPEPRVAAEAARDTGRGWEAVRHWFSTAVAGPFADFMRRPLWLVILIFVVAYKLGEAMAGVMATPLYISLGFSLNEIAAVSKLVGFFATVAGRTLRRGGDGAVRHPAVAFGVRRAAVGGEFILRVAGGGRPPDRLFGALRYRREPDGRDGGHGACGVSLEPVLARLHRDPVRVAFFARGGRAHTGSIVRRRAGRRGGLGEILSDHDRDHGAGAFAAHLDRTAERDTSRSGVTSAFANEVRSAAVRTVIGIPAFLNGTAAQAKSTPPSVRYSDVSNSMI